MRVIESIQFKRIHIGIPFTGDNDIYGHWWFEIGNATSPDSESYGWYPVREPTRIEVLIGLPGELNDGLNGTIPPRDKHHGEEADEQFCPLVSEQDERTDQDIANCLRKFAASYQGKWQWFLGWGQNCHTFQRAALRHCRLSAPPQIRRSKL